MGFGISADTSEKDVDYEIHEENFLKDFVAFSRDHQVLNEEQASVTIMGVATGMMDSYEYFTSIIVTGNASSGKSHMLNEVIMSSLEYADDVNELVYELTGGSDQAGINDPDIDDSRVLYFHELQKIPDEMLEFVKTIAEDGTFRYGRSQADADAEGGFKTDHIERDPAPVIFSFADENDAEAGKDQELRSRMVEVKVDSGPEKNEGVHDMKWGGNEITLSDSKHNYIRERPARAHKVKAHIRDMPMDVDVVIPYGSGDFEGDDWCAADVVKPMFNFEQDESTRASANLAGLTMGSALLNYHARDTVCTECGKRFGPDEAAASNWECTECDDDDADLSIIANETDVGNLIACRNTLLATTHGLTDKKFTVLDAIRARGGQANKKGTAVQATKQDIISEIQENDDVATMTKGEIESILEELDEHLIINTKDNPEDRRENLYVYDGGSVFNAPNIFDYYDRFANVEDPIRDQPIEQSIEEQLEELNAKMDVESVVESTTTASEAMGGSDGSDGGLSRFEDGGSGDGPSLSETAENVAQRLKSNVSGCVVPEDVMAANDLKVSHMVGDTPVTKDDDTIRPEREPRGDDRVDGFMSPDRDTWPDDMTFNDVEEAIEDAIEELKTKNVLQFEPQNDGSVLVTVDV